VTHGITREIARTKRLVVRTFGEADREALVALACDPVVMRYIGRAGGGRGERTREEAEAMFERLLERGQTNPYSMWAVTERHEDDLIGWCGMQDLPGSTDIEIGWIFDALYWGRGYATEAGRAVLAYGFDRLALERIVAVAMPENVKSTNVMRRLGMRDCGIARFYGRELAHFSVTAAEFEAARSRRE
jgi:ribosomal-protein-alanine N-acetyltransferase